MKKLIFLIFVLFLLLVTVIYVEKFAVSDEDLKKGLEDLSDEELEYLLNQTSISENNPLVGEASRSEFYRTYDGKVVSSLRVYELSKLLYEERSYRNLQEREIKSIIAQTQINCNFKTAQELLATCPTENEIKIIRNDFNIVFDKTPAQWSCTNGGKESSVMLTMYNTFRLMKCTPFNQKFIWAPKYNNMYDWTKSLNLKEIQYFSCPPNENCFNHAGSDTIYLLMDDLDNPIYREVINSNTGSGVGFLPVLTIHESRHTVDGGHKGHTCALNDQTLQELGAWGVQYHLLNMLANNTGNYFSSYEENRFRNSAKNILKTRFCS